jgi:hypothetical protein
MKEVFIIYRDNNVLDQPIRIGVVRDVINVPTFLKTFFLVKSPYQSAGFTMTSTEINPCITSITLKMESISGRVVYEKILVERVVLFDTINE